MLLLIVGASLPARVAAADDQPSLEERVKALEEELARRPIAPPAPPASRPAEAVFTVGAYVETFYQWNFNEPSNGITNYRGFDNRHNTFTLSNVALDAHGSYAGAEARVTLQFGHTPDTYYLAEPTVPGSSGADASDKDLWKYLQQAYAGYTIPWLGGLTVQGGIFLSPVGPESIAVKDDWNISRSNLFFGLPFYHAGIHAALAVDSHWTVGLGLVNGWNTVVDNNPEKSFHARVTYAADSKFSWTLLYLGGIERPDGAPEGDPWRSLFDTHIEWKATDWLELNPHFDAGFEPTDFGVSYWVAGALSARFKLTDWLFAAVRADAFYEYAAADTTGEASRIFWPVDWVTSGTLTLEARLLDHASFRLEYRHDHAAGDMFFSGDVTGDGMTNAFVPNARRQDTLTAGAVAWF
ncbi:MAG: outer membrane beta-barrel protein [Polyangiaceae bacterium]